MLIRPIVAIVISIADPHLADAAAVTAGELVAMTSPVGMSADVLGLVTPVSAIVLAVTMPPRRDTSMSRLTAKIVCTTRYWMSIWQK